MKTIPIEELGRRVADTLKMQGGDEPVLLTENSAALGLLLRLPNELKNSEIDTATWSHGPDGAFLMILQVLQGSSRPQRTEANVPVLPQFGNCRGMLTVIAEDDEHLKDFDEHMR